MSYEEFCEQFYITAFHRHSVETEHTKRNYYCELSVLGATYRIYLIGNEYSACYAAEDSAFFDKISEPHPLFKHCLYQVYQHAKGCNNV